MRGIFVNKAFGLSMGLVVSLMVTSCASLKLNPNAKNVIVSKAEPAEKCEELGVVSCSSAGFVKYDVNEIRIKIKNDAAELGANYVRLESSTGYSETGTAYFCPKK